MAVAGFSLLLALWAGLTRLGWNPALPGRLPGEHGPLMVSGFLGTLIGLERAAALGTPWSYGAPILTAIATLSALAGLPSPIGYLLTLAGSLVLAAVFLALYRQQPSGFFMVMQIGALLWSGGNLILFMGNPVHEAAPWWIGFLVLIIGGERLELSRVLRRSLKSRTLFLLATGTFVAGLCATLLAFEAGIRLSGMGLVLLASWLLRYDLAWLTVQRPGLPRYMALCLLTGYIWLGVGGVLWVLFGHLFTVGPYYDAMLHAIFLGFVFSMVFGHAPIILPSVMDIAIPFRRSFYGHLALLHLSLVVRVTGDLGVWMDARQWGGFASGLAILLFLANTAHAVRIGQSLHAETARRSRL